MSPAEAPTRAGGPVDPFFVVGSGRSGSTLLRLMLASHSHIAIPPETWFLLDLVRRFPLEGPLAEEQRAAAVRLMVSHYRWPDMEVSEEELSRELAGLRGAGLRELVELVYRHHMVRQGKVRWGDKTPGYIRIAPQLARLFEGARFIELVRDGRDVARSFQSTGWYGPWLPANTKEWREAVNAGVGLRRSGLRHRILLVRYEDLVLSPEKELRRICGFLGEEFEPAMLDCHGSVERLVPGRERPIHSKLLRRPEAGDVFRWKSEMRGWEVAQVEAFAARELHAAGYKPRFAGPLAPLWRPGLRLALALCHPPASLAARAARRAVRLFRPVSRPVPSATAPESPHAESRRTPSGTTPPPPRGPRAG